MNLNVKAWWFVDHGRVPIVHRHVPDLTCKGLKLFIVALRAVNGVTLKFASNEVF